MKSENDCFLTRKLMTNLDSVLKSRDITLPTKVTYSCESWTVKKGRAPKNWCFQIMMLEKTTESPLDSKEIKPVNPLGNQSWIFTGRTDAEAPILWATDLKSWLTEKGLLAGKDWGKEEEGATEDEMFGWHHWLNGHEWEQILGYINGQGRLVYSIAVHGVTKSRTWLSDWKAITKTN